MSLPPEIRLMVYELAVRENIAAAVSNANGLKRKPPRPPYIGALALIHTSTGIRKESRNTMRAIAYRQWQVLCARSKSLCEEWRSATRGGSDYFEAMDQSFQVVSVYTSLEEPRSIKSLRS